MIRVRVVTDDPTPRLARIKRKSGDAIRRALRESPDHRPFAGLVRWLRRWRLKQSAVADVVADAVANVREAGR